jgi:hypothetical protein
MTDGKLSPNHHAATSELREAGFENVDHLVALALTGLSQCPAPSARRGT